MATENPRRPVLHVVVVGFHHQRGSEVEYSFPPLIESEDNWSKKLPVEWKSLPFMAMPDGAHNYDSESAYFHLPSIIGNHDNKKQTTLFVISCYRQIHSKELKKKSKDITRDTVQKSVCIISQLPLYGYIQTKLEVTTKVYFDEKDFSQVRILEDLYKNLNSSLSPDIMTESLLHVGLSPSELIIKFRQRVLVLFKLLLLEKKVLFYGYPVLSVCSVLLSLVSLMPRMLDNGLVHAAFTQQESYYEQDSDPLYPAHLNGYRLNTDQFGLPLAVFTNNSIFHPYLCLQQMDVIKDPKVDSFVVGASNALYQHQKHLFHVMVDLESSNIDILDEDLKDDLSLSTADLRFTDYIVQHVTGHEDNEERETGWDGSEDWIRAQFKVYLLSLLSTVHHLDKDDFENFNESFFSSWKKTHNYSVWSSQNHVGIDEVHSGHPFQGQVGLNDLKIRLANAYQDVAAKSMQTEQGRKLGQAVAQTGRAVGGALSSARSYVTSWLADFAKEKPQLQDSVTEKETTPEQSEQDNQSRARPENDSQEQSRDIGTSHNTPSDTERSCDILIEKKSHDLKEKTCLDKEMKQNTSTDQIHSSSSCRTLIKS